MATPSERPSPRDDSIGRKGSSSLAFDDDHVQQRKGSVPSSDTGKWRAMANHFRQRNAIIEVLLLEGTLKTRLARARGACSVRVLRSLSGSRT
jgi:hypothetical protein